MPLGEPVARSPLVVDGLLRRVGLFNVHKPHLEIACPSVFAKAHWVRHQLCFSELLHTFDVPVSMDYLFQSMLGRRNVPFHVSDTLSPLVVTTLFRVLWGCDRGG